MDSLSTARRLAGLAGTERLRARSVVLPYGLLLRARRAVLKGERPLRLVLRLLLVVLLVYVREGEDVRAEDE